MMVVVVVVVCGGGVDSLLQTQISDDWILKENQRNRDFLKHRLDVDVCSSLYGLAGDEVCAAGVAYKSMNTDVQSGWLLNVH